MKYNVQINNLESLDEIPNYWTNDDYRKMLELFDFPDSKGIKDENLFEMLQMAITDFEPAEAARILLEYKLSDHLNPNQMDQMSHDMLLDKISEEYADISLHYPLYNINQLLFKAYNGTFPNIKATRLQFSLSSSGDAELSNAQVLRVLGKGLTPGNLIVRMFEENLQDDSEFGEADSILWEVRNSGADWEVITSEYWIGRDDIAFSEFESDIDTE